jgi:hypothetical protein
MDYLVHGPNHWNIVCDSIHTRMEEMSDQERFHTECQSEQEQELERQFELAEAQRRAQQEQQLIDSMKESK